MLVAHVCRCILRKATQIARLTGIKICCICKITNSCFFLLCQLLQVVIRVRAIASVLLTQYNCCRGAHLRGLFFCRRYGREKKRSLVVGYAFWMIYLLGKSYNLHCSSILNLVHHHASRMHVKDSHFLLTFRCTDLCAKAEPGGRLLRKFLFGFPIFSISI